MMFNLYDRLKNQGTISEPQGLPDSDFSLPSTVNWMHALALLVRENKLDFAAATKFYQSTEIRIFSEIELNTIFEQLLFATHQLSALFALRDVSSKTDIARVGIVAWYYGVYAAASAMITAKDGSFQDDHTGTANQWDRHFAANNIVMSPFENRLSTLVETDAKKEIQAMGEAKPFCLQRPAKSAAEALGACYSYLSGSGDFYSWKTRENLRSSKNFKALGFTDFRKKEAGAMRDRALCKKSVCFMHQAIRYRGKANYRDAIFLGYGKSVEILLSDYDRHLCEVLSAFLAMAGGYVSHRIGASLWQNFTADLENNRSFSMSLNSIWL